VSAKVCIQPMSLWLIMSWWSFQILMGADNARFTTAITMGNLIGPGMKRISLINKRPVIDKEKCIKCGICWIYCPDMAYTQTEDGFTLSHVVEAVELLSQEEVDQYLPPFKPRYRLDPRKPITMGPVGMPEVYSEARVAHNEALKASRRVILQGWKEFADLFGRQYNPVETYRSEDAEVLLVTMGSISETAMTAIDTMRDKGQKAGLVKIRLWRPFPGPEFRKAAGKAKILAVVDRCLAPGAICGPVGAELRSLFYKVPGSPKIFNFIAGLGGRDVTVARFEEMVDKATAFAKKRPKELYEVIGVREK